VDKKKTEIFRGKLLKEKTRLEDEYKKIHDENYEAAVAQQEVGGDDNYEDHMADGASNIFDRERDLSLEQNAKDLLDQVEAALTRLDSGKYGPCGNCGKPIDEARLRAIPYTDLCIDCKAEEEKRW